MSCFPWGDLVTVVRKVAFLNLKNMISLDVGIPLYGKVEIWVERR